MECAARLYEQEPGEPCGSSRFWDYAVRWLRWVRAGLGDEGVAIQIMLKRSVRPECFPGSYADPGPPPLRNAGS